MKQNPPNILLRGCTRSQEAISYVYSSILGEKGDIPRAREEEIEVPGFNASKTAKVVRWPWGIQIWAAPYRTRSDKWWNSLLKTVSAKSVLTTGASRINVKLIMICAADTVPSQTQMVFRAHLEDDYKTARYVLTCAMDTFMERSLESRCVVMVPDKKDRWDDSVLRLKMTDGKPVTWDQVKNAWLADIPAFRVMDAMFEPEMARYPLRSPPRKDLVLAWCRYADLLKSCYQEITILRKAWEWIQTHHKENTTKPRKARGKSSA